MEAVPYCGVKTFPLQLLQLLLTVGAFLQCYFVVLVLGLVCMSVHYESDFSSTEEFQFQLSAVDTIISQHQDAHIILGGDF